MNTMKQMLMATAVALPLSVAGWAASAADLVQTLKDQDQFSKTVKAIEDAGLADSLQGEGPFTVFAPTNEAFNQLPEGALDQLMQGDQGQLQSLLQNHVVEGEKLATGDLLNKQMKVDTLAGDQLTVDGQHQVLLVVPTGLRLTQIGDRVYVEREAAVGTMPAVEVMLPGSSGTSGSQQGDAGQQQESTSDSSQQNEFEPAASQRSAARNEFWRSGSDGGAERASPCHGGRARH